MSDQAPQVEQLVQAGQALENLLDTLLSEVPEYQDPPPPKVQVQAPVSPSPAPQPVAAPQLKEPRALPIQQATPAVEPAEALRPAWVEDGLKVLIVHVGGLRMAVPLIRLSSISPAGADEDVLHLPAQPAWHGGVVSIRGQQTVRVDPAALLGLNTQRADTAYLLLIDEGRFALEVDGMEEPLSLTPDEVRWRRRDKGREWVMGVLPEQACMLLDLDAIAVRLQRHVHKQAR